MQKRLIWADSLRGILIVLVVLGHAIQAQLGGGCFDNHVWNYIYSFHMAAFMAVSGWLSFRANRQPAIIGGGRLSTFYRRVQQLLIPFFLWSLLKLFSLIVFSLNEVFSILHPDPYYWFLWALFWIQVLFMFGDWIAEKSRVRQEIIVILICAALVLLMTLFDVRVVGIQYISYYFIFYAVGYYLHKYDFLMMKNKVLLVILVILWTIMAWFWDMHELPSFLVLIPLPGAIVLYIYRFLTALIAAYILFCVAPMLLNAKNNLNKPIIWLGKVSLGIYVAHLLFIYQLTKSVNALIDSPLVIISIVFIASLVFSSGIVWVLSKLKYSARLMLGKI